MEPISTMLPRPAASTCGWLSGRRMCDYLRSKKTSHMFPVSLGAIQQNEQHRAHHGRAGRYQDGRREGLKMLEDDAHQNGRSDAADIAHKVDKAAGKSRTPGT